MSCVMSDTRVLAALAQYTQTILDSGFDYQGFDAPRSLFLALRDCESSVYFGTHETEKIYLRLYDFNACAYNGRYNGCPADPVPAEAPDMPDVKISWKPRETVHDPEYCAGYRHKIGPQHYKLLKLLDFYIYQVSEDSTYKKPLYNGLVDLQHVLTSFIAQNSAEYAALKWGQL